MSRALGLVAWRRLGVCLGAGLALGLVLSGTWLYVSREATSGTEVFELVIPAGTSARIAQGESPPSIPSRLELRQGDRLVVHNKDDVEHQIGALYVRAGATSEVPISSAVNRTQFLCTFHSAGQIDLDVAQTKKPASIFLASLLVGLPLGFASFAVISFSNRI